MSPSHRFGQLGPTPDPCTSAVQYTITDQHNDSLATAFGSVGVLQLQSTTLTAEGDAITPVSARTTFTNVGLPLPDVSGNAQTITIDLANIGTDALRFLQHPTKANPFVHDVQVLVHDAAGAGGGAIGTAIGGAVGLGIADFIGASVVAGSAFAATPFVLALEPLLTAASVGAFGKIGGFVGAGIGAILVPHPH